MQFRYNLAHIQMKFEKQNEKNRNSTGKSKKNGNSTGKLEFEFR